MTYFNPNTASSEKRNELDPLVCFRRETKALRKEAIDNGKHGLVNYLDSVLDFIQYAQADYDRLNWLAEHPELFNFQTKELRYFVDQQIEKQIEKKGEGEA